MLHLGVISDHCAKQDMMSPLKCDNLHNWSQDIDFFLSRDLFQRMFETLSGSISHK